MNITFSLNKTLAYSEAKSRFDEFYASYRSATGAPLGEFRSHHDCMSWLNQELTSQDDEFCGRYVVVMGKKFFVELVNHGHLCVNTMQFLERELGRLHRGECSAADVRKVRRQLDDLLDRIEW